MSNSIMTTLMWAIAIAHVITDRLLWPFFQSIFNELTAETSVASAPPVLAVATPIKAPATKAPATPRPARRRRTSNKTAVE